jgi:hypothetical protein
VRSARLATRAGRAAGLCDGGCAVGDPELLVQPLGVGLDRARPDVELGGGLRDRQSASEGLEDLSLAFGEGRDLRLGSEPDLAGQTARQLGWDDGVATCGAHDGIDDLLSVGILGEVAGGAFLERAEHDRAVGER